MILPRLLGLLAVVAICAGCPCVCAGERKIVFADDFDRVDAENLGKGWRITGAAVLKDKAALFHVNEEEFRPRIRHEFPAQKQGKFSVSFLMDWARATEGTWGFYMQLGNSAEMPRFLIREHDLAKGMRVNLIWGGGELVDFQDRGSFGYLNKGEFKALFVVNNEKDAKTVVERPVVTIDVDVDSSTYAVRFNGKTYPGLPFENKGPIDSIRFITNGCSAAGFSKSSIDNVIISREE